MPCEHNHISERNRSEALVIDTKRTVQNLRTSVSIMVSYYKYRWRREGWGSRARWRNDTNNICTCE
jgi:hypothetical protein